MRYCKGAAILLVVTATVMGAPALARTYEVTSSIEDGNFSSSWDNGIWTAAESDTIDVHGHYEGFRVPLKGRFARQFVWDPEPTNTAGSTWRAFGHYTDTGDTVNYDCKGGLITPKPSWVEIEETSDGGVRVDVTNVGSSGLHIILAHGTDETGRPCSSYDQTYALLPYSIRYEIDAMSVVKTIPRSRLNRLAKHQDYTVPVDDTNAQERFPNDCTAAFAGTIPCTEHFSWKGDITVTRTG